MNHNNGLENESLGRCSILVFFNKKDKTMKTIAEEIQEAERLMEQNYQAEEHNRALVYVRKKAIGLGLSLEDDCDGTWFLLEDQNGNQLYRGENIYSLDAYVDGYAAGLKAGK